MMRDPPGVALPDRAATPEEIRRATGEAAECVLGICIRNALLAALRDDIQFLQELSPSELDSIFTELSNEESEAQAN